LAYQNNASVLLGSATPSVETLFNCEQEKYHLVQLAQRFGQALLPTVQIIDMKEATREKQVRGMFSNVLLQAIQDTLAQKQQVILFQNRRGYSPFCLCTTCGWVPQCRNCDVSMTYHKSTDQLHCHYCGSRSPYIRICPACGGNHIVAKSFGTEKVEDDIQTLFPNARVQRFDGDTLRNKN
jgi:primosomal protein N' (replication factor Y)